MYRYWKIVPLTYMLRAMSLVIAFTLGACAPEVGTKAWCDRMDAKAEGDWTVNEAADYARYCVLNTYKDPDDD